MGTSKKSVDARLKLLNRAVLPIILFRAPRWPFTIKRAERLDRTQFRMCLKIIAPARLPEDSQQTYNARCRSIVGGVVAKAGRWSEFWATYLINWSEHLSRPANRMSPAAQLWCVQDSLWLESMRMAFVSLHRTLQAGGTGTRRLAEAPKARWEASTEVAIDWLVKHGRPLDALKV